MDKERNPMVEPSYHLSQALVNAHQALREAQARIAELEARLTKEPMRAAHTQVLNAFLDPRVKKLLSYGCDSLTLLDAQGKILYTNLEPEAFGYTQAEYTTFATHTLLHPDDLAKGTAFLQMLLAHPGTTQTIELSARAKTGPYRWLEITATNLLDDPEIGAIVACSSDITNLKEAEATAQQSEALFRATFEQAVVGMAHVTLDGRWLWVNQRLCEIVGYSAAELVQKTFHEITYPEDLAADLAFTQQVFTGAARSYALQKRYLHKSGQVVWVNLTVSLVYDAAGLPAYTVAVIEDITQFKAAEQALVQSEARYRHIVEDQLDLICRIQLDFRLTFVNQAYSKALGKPPDELIGQSILNWILPAYQASVIAELTALHAANAISINENPMRLADGRLRWFQWTNRLIVDKAGRALEYQSVGRDVTERRAAEEAERAQRQFAEVLRDSVATLTSSLDVNKVMQQILGAVATVVPSEAASILLFEGEYGHIAYLRGFSPEAEAFLKNYQFSTTSVVGEQPISNKQPYFVPDTASEVNWVPLPVSQWIRSSIGIPIEMRGVVIGLLCVDSATPMHFQPGDIEKLRVFAHYASLALENADHVTQLEARVTERTAELQAAKEQVEAILHHSLDSIAFTKFDLQIQQTNAPFHALFGGQPCDDFDQSLMNFIYPADVAQLAALVQTVIRQQTGQQIELRACRPEGTVFDAELSIGYINHGGLVCTLRDITARKQAESALRESEARYRLLADNITDIITRVNVQGDYLYISPSCQTVLGYTVEELMSHPRHYFFHPDDAENLQAEFAQIATQRTPLPNITYQVRHKAGHWIWLETQTQTLYSETTGELLEFISSSRDITARKRADEALRAQRDFLQLVIDHVPDLIMVKDQAGRFELVNEAAAQTYELTPTAMLGKTDAALHTTADERTRFQAQDQTVRQSGKPLFIPESDLSGRTYQTNVIPLQNPGGEAGRLLIVCSDITARKQAESALQQALAKEKELGELKSRFVSMASHEFRTPLTSIALLTDTLRAYRHKLSHEQIEQRLGKIQDQIGYLRDILDDVLQLARLQARRTEFNPASLSLDALCRSVIDELQSPPGAPQRLRYHGDEALPESELDKKLMRQIISNLLSNALKYSPADTLVEVRLAATTDTLTLQVQDQGIGIPATDLNHLFEPFHRAANVGTIAGTGLGLVIAKEAAELHGGVIAVASQLGHGATFTVSIPRVTQGAKPHGQNRRD